MGRKNHCCVTTGQIKARNSAESLFILQCISVTNSILSDNAFDINIACLLLHSVIVIVVIIFDKLYLCCCFVPVVCFVLFCLFLYME